MKLARGDMAPLFTTKDIDGRDISLENLRGAPILLSFHRFSNCPFCNLRVHKLKSRHAELSARGLVVVAVFESSEANLRNGIVRQKLSFPILSDSSHRLYDLYGVGHSFVGLVRTLVSQANQTASATDLGLMSPIEREGSLSQMPADFLIDRSGRIHTAHYGRDAGDHVDFGVIEQFADESPSITKRMR